MATIQFSDGTKVNFNGTPSPEDIDFVAKQHNIQPGGGQAQPHQNNILQDIVTDPVKTLIATPATWLSRAAVSGAGALIGGETGDKLQEAATKPLDFSMPFLGNMHMTAPGGYGDIAAQGLKTAAYLMPADRAATAGASIFKGAVGKAIGAGAGAGAQFGLLSGAGAGLEQPDATPGSVVGSSLLGGLGGLLTGSAVAGTGAAVSKGLRSVAPFLGNVISKGPSEATQIAARNTLESELRDTAGKYVAPSRTLHEMETGPKTNPVGVLTSYGQGKALPILENGKMNPDEAIDFLKSQIGEISKIKNDAVSANNVPVQSPNFRSSVSDLIESQKGWSAMKKANVAAQTDKVLTNMEGAYPRGYMPLTEVDRLKTEQTGLSKSYNNMGKDPFEYDAHAIIGKAARNTVENETGSPVVKELNKLVQSHYDAIDLLESLRGKAPHGGLLTKAIGRATGEVVGAGVGLPIGHPFIGAIAGRAAADTVEGIMGNNFISNPLKRALIKNMDDVPAPIIQQALSYLADKEAERGSMLALPPGSPPGSPENPRIMPSPSGTPSISDTNANSVGGLRQRMPAEGVKSSSPRSLPYEWPALPPGNTIYTPPSGTPASTDASANLVGGIRGRNPVGPQTSVPNILETTQPTTSANPTANANVASTSTVPPIIPQSGLASLGTILGGAALGTGAVASLRPQTMTYRNPTSSAAKPAETKYVPSTDPLVSKLRKEIAFRESGTSTDPYTAINKNKNGTTDYGKYQINEQTLASHSKSFLGRVVTPKELLASPALQDKFFDKAMEHLKELGVTDANSFMALWHKGWGDVSTGRINKLKHNPEVKKYLNNRSLADLNNQ